MNNQQNALQTKIFVIDDDPSLRKALTLVLEQEGMAVSTFNSAEDFLSTEIPVCRCCAIVDMHMPGMNGLELQSVLLKKRINLPVIFLTGYGEIPSSVEAIKAGAEDYLVKPVTSDKLLAAVHLALARFDEIYKANEQRQKAEQRLELLTNREREVLQLAIKGFSDKEIARSLDISYRTVEKHKSNLMQKTNSKKLLDLVTLASASSLSDKDSP